MSNKFDEFRKHFKMKIRMAIKCVNVLYSCSQDIAFTISNKFALYYAIFLNVIFRAGGFYNRSLYIYLYKLLVIYVINSLS